MSDGFNLSAGWYFPAPKNFKHKFEYCVKNRMIKYSE
jgi:hypothetical protein